MSKIPTLFVRIVFFGTIGFGGAASAIAASAIVQVSPSTPKSVNAQGKIAFLRCAACHSINGKMSNKVGPDLRGIVGADAGRAEGFAYSEAFKKAATGGLKWDAVTLKRWIDNPSALVPNTSMAYANSLSGVETEALIGYLSAQK
ncbi:MAG: c-type cytochrome [Aeromicrobium sp.]|nr:c-type cytochrome [Burkholderiales bacterium]